MEKKNYGVDEDDVTCTGRNVAGVFFGSETIWFARAIQVGQQHVWLVKVTSLYYEKLLSVLKMSHLERNSQKMSHLGRNSQKMSPLERNSQKCS
jgi:hypothetical protein